MVQRELAEDLAIALMWSAAACAGLDWGDQDGVQTAVVSAPGEIRDKTVEHLL